VYFEDVIAKLAVIDGMRRVSGPGKRFLYHAVEAEIFLFGVPCVKVVEAQCGGCGV
jgi:hypothetical protein